MKDGTRDGSSWSERVVPSSSGPQLRKVEHARVFQRAVEQIRELIVQGAFVLGEKLPTEQEIGKALNVGRSSIREALRVLEAEGMIEVRRGTGAFVTWGANQSRTRLDVTRWLVERWETLEMLLQVRERIEGLTASLAASSAGNADLARLEEIMEKQAALAGEVALGREEDVDGMAELDAAFHIMIGAMSGNDIANEIIAHVLPAFTESNKAVLYVAGRGERLVLEHRAILAAIQARNAKEAEAIMRDHIARVRGDIGDLKGGPPAA